MSHHGHGPDRHPDDLLSAHVDGELDPAEDAWVVDHLEGCAACRQSVGDLVEARALLRGLPPVDGSPLIEGFLARHRRGVRLGAAFVAVAAVVLVALGTATGTERRALVPDISALAASHRDGPPEVMDGMERRSSGAYPAPPGLIGSAVSLSRHEMWDGEDVAVVVYRAGDLDVAVYQQPGRLDWDRLPAGDVAAIGDADVWVRRGNPVVAVTQRGDLVVTVVSSDRAAVLTAVAGMPEWRRRAVWDRMHDASQRLVRAFALEG
ncbi:MAG: zf-HC2 domain-containing protein [Acidimicrobiia bacterium]